MNKNGTEDTCKVLGCESPATTEIRFASGVRRYCESCAGACCSQVMQPKLVLENKEEQNRE